MNTTTIMTLPELLDQLYYLLQRELAGEAIDFQRLDALAGGFTFQTRQGTATLLLHEELREHLLEHHALTADLRLLWCHCLDLEASNARVDQDIRLVEAWLNQDWQLRQFPDRFELRIQPFSLLLAGGSLVDWISISQSTRQRLLEMFEDEAVRLAEWSFETLVLRYKLKLLVA